MRTLLAALIAGALSCAVGPTSAQEKKSEPAKKDETKAEVKKAQKTKIEPGEKEAKAEVTKDDGKKKVKKGGC